MAYTAKIKTTRPSDFLYAGDEIELALNHGQNSIGFEVNTQQHFFTISVDNGPFKSIHNVRIGLSDEVARDFILALNTWAASTGLIKPKAW